jgi:hypothetical protein
MVLDEDDYISILRDPERVDLVDDPEAQIVSFPTGGSGGKQQLAELLRSQDLLRPGTLAIQSPYDTERYVTADSAVTEFTVEKFLILTRLAMLLGATRVAFEEVRVDHSKSSIDTNINVKNPSTSVDASASHAIEAGLRERLRGEHIFPGGAPDIAGARQLLSVSRLAGDPHLVTLIELRDGGNPIERQEIQFNGTREAAGNISAALRVATGPGRLKLAGFTGSLKRQWESRIEVEVRTLVEF